MNFEHKQTHQTVFGGLVTISVVMGFFYGFVRSMVRNDEFYQKDTISSTSYRFGYDQP
jgi:hypothetical protein